MCTLQTLSYFIFTITLQVGGIIPSLHIMQVVAGMTLPSEIYISLVWTSIPWKTNASSPLISKTSLGAYFLIVSPASELLLLLDEFSLVTVWSFHFFPFSIQFYSKHWTHSLYLIHRWTQTHTCKHTHKSNQAICVYSKFHQRFRKME